MGEVSIIGVDLAKNVFQLHGAAADGSVVFLRIPTHPVGCSDNIRSVIPGYPVT